jgi:transcription elongation factor Elf1
MEKKLRFKDVERLMRDLKYTEKPCPFCGKVEWAVEQTESGNPKLMCANCGLILEFNRFVLEGQIRFA